MSDMVGNPEDRFSRIVAHIIIRVLKLRVSLLRLLYALRKLGHAIYGDFLSCKN